MRELVLLALLSALMFASKIVLAGLPNIHLNAVFILLAVQLFGIRSLYMVAVYVLLEGIFYGFGTWFVAYLYAWPLLVFAALPLRKANSPLFFAVLAAVHGLLFGAFCSLPNIVLLGFRSAVAWWISGIPYDCIHAAGNFVLVLLLLKPFCSAAQKILQRGH